MINYGGYSSINNIQRKLYQRERQFNNFREISEEEYAKIIKIKDSIINAFEKHSAQAGKENQKGINGLNRYIAFLQYLTNPQIHKTLPTYDERILLLILGTDPELQTFYNYLTAPTTEIETKKDGIKTTERYIDENAYSNTVREKIGFYDPKLRFYEEAFFKKYISRNSLVKESKRSKMNQLIARANKIENFDQITDIRFEELQAMADQWRLEFNDVDYKTISYHVGVQYDYFRLRTIAEQELMLILLTDPNMEMLKIYSEESQVKNIAQRCQEEFGFYSQSFINLEKLFKERFYPELKLSEWTI